MIVRPHVEASKKLVEDYGFRDAQVVRYRNKYRMDMVRMAELVEYSMQEHITSEQIREVKDYIESQPITDEMKDTLLDIMLGYDF